MTEQSKGKEELLGYIVTTSGSIVLADGAVRSAIGLPAQEIVSLDLEKDNCKIPVYRAHQGDKQFIIIPVDSAEPVTWDTPDQVSVEDQLAIQEATEDE